MHVRLIGAQVQIRCERVMIMMIGWVGGQTDP